MPGYESQNPLLTTYFIFIFYLYFNIWGGSLMDLAVLFSIKGSVLQLI